MNKRLCEYIGKLLLTIDTEKAAKILRKIYAQKRCMEIQALCAMKKIVGVLYRNWRCKRGSVGDVSMFLLDS